MMEHVLTCEGISKTYRDGNRAVHDVSLAVRRGKCLGLVGESGSGKSTLSRCLLGLEQMDSGVITLNGYELTAMSRRHRRMAQREMQMVFQNPNSSFNSRLKIRDSLMEPLDCFPDRGRDILHRKDISYDEYAAELMELVGLTPDMLDRLPSELSGGQKQRVSIARALSSEPAVIILDEPTASLDVSVQARVLNLLKDLQDELGLSYLFISHDMAAVHFMADEMVVMRRGELIDSFPANDLTDGSRDPYTRELVSLFSL